MNIKDYLTLIREKVDNRLLILIEEDSSDIRNTAWHKAMEYSLFSGGKRLRPILAIATAQVFSQSDTLVESLACVLEFIHTYSLIHDDLPALDDDMLRRGKPTCHTKFGVQTAIWAGVALLNKAFLTVQWAAKNYPDDAELIWEIASQIFRHAGIDGMVGGQIADLLAENKQVTIEEVKYIHQNKTAAMIHVSVMVGCNLFCNDLHIKKEFSLFGEKIGLAFQIIDDILDIQSETDILGKDVGSDLKKGKATYPSLVGIDKAKNEVRALLDSAITSISKTEFPVETLIQIANYLYSRKM